MASHSYFMLGLIAGILIGLIVGAWAQRGTSYLVVTWEQGTLPRMRIVKGASLAAEGERNHG